MAVFSYEALDEQSRQIRGVVEADSPRHVRLQLRRQGVRPTEIRQLEQQSESTAVPFWRQLADRLSAWRQRERVTDAFENLLTLLESHVQLDAALVSLTDQRIHQSNTLPVLQQLHDGVRSGQELSDIMRRFPFHFDAADVAIVESGEHSGELALSLKRLVARRQMTGKLISNLSGALAYPAFLIIFGCGVVVFLTHTVLPNLNNMLMAAGGQVPLVTQALVAFGQILAWGVLPALVFSITLVPLVLHQFPHLQEQLVKTLQRLPMIGTAWLHWQLAQFCMVLQTLLASGVQLPEALRLAGHAAGSGPVLLAANRLRESLIEGQDIIADTDDDGVFPKWLWQALAVGQEAGDLVSVLERVGQRFEQAATKSTQRLAAVLEPAMILFIGLFVGLIAYAAMLPIMKLGGAW